NGKVMIAAGFDYDYNSLNRAELYDPATGKWISTGSLNTSRVYHTATLLTDGKVLVVGGFDAEGSKHAPSFEVTQAFSSAELYDPAPGTWGRTASPKKALIGPATPLPNGTDLMLDSYDNTAELYDPGTSAMPNLIDNAQFFVRQHYRDFLNREPDTDGLNFWTAEIVSCGSDAQCVEAKRINVSAAYFLSIEFQKTGYLVYRLYKSSYGNLPSAPVPITLNEFLPDTQKIGQGVIVNQSGWEQVLENNKQSFTSEFVQRSRFTSAFLTSMTPAQFVDRLFTNAGVTPSVTDRQAVIGEFGSATSTSDVAARARTLRRVAENST